MHNFRKRPVPVSARQFTASSMYDVLSWIRTQGGTATEAADALGPVLVIRTLEGSMAAHPGDWIVRGVRGEFHPVRGDIFAETYEPADAVLAVPPVPADRAAILAEEAEHLRTVLYPSVYDDAGQHAAEGVSRAAGELRKRAREARCMASEQPGRATLVCAAETGDEFDYRRDPDAELILNTLPPEAQRSIRTQLAAEARQDGAQSS